MTDINADNPTRIQIKIMEIWSGRMGYLVEGAGGPAMSMSASMRVISDIEPLRGILPFREIVHTQLSPCEAFGETTTVSDGNVWLLKTQVFPTSTTSLLMSSDYIDFVVPLMRTCELRVNGEDLDLSSIYLHAGNSGVHTRGDGRKTIDFVLRRHLFVEAAAASRGIEPEDLVLQDGLLKLSAQTAHALKTSLLAPLELCLSGGDHDVAVTDALVENAFTAILDAYLRSHPDDSRKRRHVMPERIVQTATDYFLSAGNRAVFLPEICKAVGASQTALYDAFKSIYDEPPLRYLRRLRLMRARTLLLGAGDCQSLVKRAAIDCGFSEMGRFAAEYRKVFGENPSATLAQGLSKQTGLRTA